MESMIDKRVRRRLKFAGVLCIPLAVLVSSCGLQPHAPGGSVSQGDVTGSVHRAPVIRRQYSLTAHRDALAAGHR